MVIHDRNALHYKAFFHLFFKIKAFVRNQKEWGKVRKLGCFLTLKKCVRPRNGIKWVDWLLSHFRAAAGLKKSILISLLYLL